MARVFITNDTGLDFSRAEKYGELVRVTTGMVDVFNPDRIRLAVAEGLRGFDPEKDYVLLTGSIVVAACIGAWAQYGPADVPIRALLWDAKKRDYFVRSLLF